MKNNAERAAFDAGKRSPEDEPESGAEAFDLPVSEKSGSRQKGGEHDAHNDSRLRAVREELKNAPIAAAHDFRPLSAGSTAFVSTAEKLAPRKVGTFRRWMLLALAGLGIAGGGKLEGADLSAGKAGAGAKGVGSVPVFKAPTQTNASSGAFTYKQEVWQPKTPEEMEIQRKARERLAEQDAQARQKAAEPSFSVTAAPGFEKGQSAPPARPLVPELGRGGFYKTHGEGAEPTAQDRGGVRREIRGNPMYGGGAYYPTHGQGPLTNGPRYPHQVPNQVYGGAYYPQQGTGISGGIDVQISSQYPDVVGYYGDAPTEKRKLFGVKYDAVTRDSSMGLTPDSSARKNAQSKKKEK